MRRPKIYLETTLFNHYFDVDREAHTATVELFEAIQSEKYEAYTSAYVIYEINRASDPKRSNMLALIDKYNIVVLPEDDEAADLTAIYIKAGVLP